MQSNIANKRSICLIFSLWLALMLGLYGCSNGDSSGINAQNQIDSLGTDQSDALAGSETLDASDSAPGDLAVADLALPDLAVDLADSGSAPDLAVEDGLADASLSQGDTSDMLADQLGLKPATITTMSFNMLCSACDPVNYDPWFLRLSHFDDIFKRHDPDLLGLQEITTAGDVKDIVSRNPQYAAIFFEGTPDHPDSTVMYRKSRFSVLEHGFFWLSPTPEIPYSFGFAGVTIPRVAIWLKMEDKPSGFHFYWVNLHVDNNSPSQEESAKLLKKHLADKALPLPIIVTGDFNSRPHHDAYAPLLSEFATGKALKNSYDMVASPIVASNQNPAPEFNESKRIDHIFVSGANWSCSTWTVDMFVYGLLDRYPSDHRAIVAELNWN